VTERPVPGDRLLWVGHATVVLDLDGTRLMTDPLLRGRVMHLRRVAPSPAAAALRDIDAVLISHLHFDHLDMPSLRRLRSSTRLVVPRGAGKIVSRAGFSDVVELAPGETTTVGGVEVVAVPAQHDGHRHPRGAFADPLGFLLSARGRRVYFAGDTEIFPGMADLAPGLDLALLPIWGWGPTLGPGHMDPSQAAEATALLRPRTAVPIHWGTFFPRGLARLRRAALVEPPQAFRAQVQHLAPEVRVELLAPGRSLALGQVGTVGA
jgi:L-ascorbate metabolism protein UlaG (beta-lactamase superfamily)